MDNLSSLFLMFTSYIMCLGVTEGAIISWQLNSDPPISGANTPIAVTVAETSSVTTVLFTLTATVDTGTALASYAITKQTHENQFKIIDVGDVDNVGKVQLEAGKALDYEVETSIVIEVTATDNTQNTALTGVATVTITVTDVTTYTPVFTTPSTATTCVEIPDQSPADTAVYTVVSADAVANTITYSIASGNTGTDFEIHSTSGTITVVNALDNARTASYDLVVYGTDAVTDTGTETGTVTVTVNVGSSCPQARDNGAGTGAVSVTAMMAGIALSLFTFM